MTSMRAQLATVALLSLTMGGPTGISAGSSSPPDVIVSPSSIGDVTFRHRFHVEDLQLGCKDCHHEKDAKKLDIPHPQYFADFWLDCTACHRSTAAPTRSQACSTCHRSSAANIADQSLSSKVVIHRTCWRCHETGTGRDASRSCKFCHDRGPAPGASPSDARR